MRKPDFRGLRPSKTRFMMFEMHFINETTNVQGTRRTNTKLFCFTCSSTSKCGSLFRLRLISPCHMIVLNDV